MGLVIAVLVVLLVLAFAYIQVQKSFNSANQEDIIEEVAVIEAPQKVAGDVVETDGAKELFAGASPVTADNHVLNSSFELAQNSAIPNSSEAPKSTVIKQEDLPKEVLNLKISNNKITPDSFTVRSGDLISLAVTSDDNKVHVFGFYDSAVAAIAMGVSEGQTKIISFNTPGPGEYIFGCGVPEHRENGEFGKMIVQQLYV